MVSFFRVMLDNTLFRIGDIILMKNVFLLYHPNVREVSEQIENADSSLKIYVGKTSAFIV